jgi:hypothetical protein
MLIRFRPCIASRSIGEENTGATARAAAALPAGGVDLV